jgi:hypothetical protein
MWEELTAYILLKAMRNEIDEVAKGKKVRQQAFVESPDEIPGGVLHS